MTGSEVEAVLGPPGDYRRGPTTIHGFAGGGWQAWDANGRPVAVGAGLGFGLRGTPSTTWQSDTAVIRVMFDASGRATNAELDTNLIRVEQSPLDNLRWRAERQWRKWFPEG